MKRSLIVIMSILTIFSAYAQEDENMPEPMIVRQIRKAMPFGNGTIMGEVMVDDDCLRISTSDSQSVKIYVDSCLWDFNLIQTLDFASGKIIVHNSYLTLKILAEKGSSLIWVDGKLDTPANVHLTADVNDSSAVFITHASTDHFTIRWDVTGNSPDYIGTFSRAQSRTRLYWNDFWDKSYIQIETPDSITGKELCLDYNLHRWSTAISPAPTIDFGVLACGDFESALRICDNFAEDSVDILHFMMEYFRYTDDEIFLACKAVPIAEKLTQQQLREVSADFASLPSSVMLPASLNLKLSGNSSPSKSHAIPHLQQAVVQCRDGKVYLLPEIPSDWNVRFKLFVYGNRSVWGEFSSGKWRGKPKSDRKVYFVY